MQNAILPSGDPVYWDENSGVGCQSPGCPSQAQANTVGTIPSEAFTLLGASTTTTTGPDCSHGSALEEIHDFTGGADGANPVGLAMDHAGNFYGTTQSGGSAGAGMGIASLSLTDAGSGWALTPVYEFSGRAAGGNPGLPLTAPNGTLFSALGGGLGNCSGQYCGQILSS